LKQTETYTSKASRLSLPHFQMLGFVLMALGAYLLYKSNWLGIAAILSGFALYFLEGGVQINFEKRVYREYFGWMNIKFGKWTSIPELEYVTLFVANYSQRGSVASIDSNFKDSKINISLVVSNAEKFDGGSFNTKEKALDTGKLFARRLNTKLLDYTGREPVWVELGEV
jgi:hypothetical protein